MIEGREEKDGWHFTCLGANQDAFAEAGGMGIHADGTGNFGMDEVAGSSGTTFRKVSRMRSQRRMDQPASNEFTDEERKRME